MQNKYTTLINSLKNILNLSKKITLLVEEEKKDEAFLLLKELESNLSEIIIHQDLESLINEDKQSRNKKGFDVLIVEDDEASSIIIKKMVKSYLEDIGFLENSIIKSVCNGKEAVEEVEKHTYDIVFMDVMMPIMDGFEATKSIRFDPLIKQPLIIIITSLNDSKDLKKGFESGANWYITKPYDKAELEMILNDIVAGKLQIGKKSSKYTLDKNKEDCIEANEKQDIQKESTQQSNEDDSFDDFFDFDNEDSFEQDTQNEQNSEDGDDFFDFDSEEIDENINTMHHDDKHKMSAEDFMDRQLVDSFDIDDILELFEEYDNIPYDSYEEYFDKMLDIVNRFIRVFNKTYEFKSLTYGFESLKNLLEQNDFSSMDVEKIEIYKELLDSVISDLKSWTQNVLIEKSAIDIHYLDASLLANIAQIDIVLKM